MAVIHYRTLKKHSALYYGLGLLFALITAAGMAAVWYMEHEGHIVTGMNNQIVWGTPHIFAVLLIVAASGALNVASIASVFGKVPYKPYARLSALLAIALLIGGLAVLVLDLGRPDRLIVAMTKYNFKSIFSWNIYLYTGFMAVVGIYLWTMFQTSMGRYNRAAGIFAFTWRLALTTGTGSIFGFLVAREAYDAAIMAPLFIASSFVYGLAFMVLVSVIIEKIWGQSLLNDDIITRFRGLFLIFIAAVFHLTVAQHIAGLYATEHHGVEYFLLVGGGIYTAMFWIGQMLIGSLIPFLFLAFSSQAASRKGLTIASLLFLIGGIAQMYVIIIGGQAYPLELFPGMEVSSSWLDGKTATYSPSLPEILLGISGVAIAFLVTGLGLKVLPFLPETID